MSLKESNLIQVFLSYIYISYDIHIYRSNRNLLLKISNILINNLFLSKKQNKQTTTRKGNRLINVENQPVAARGEGWGNGQIDDGD